MSLSGLPCEINIRVPDIRRRIWALWSNRLPEVLQAKSSCVAPPGLSVHMFLRAQDRKKMRGKDIHFMILSISLDSLLNEKEKKTKTNFHILCFSYIK